MKKINQFKIVESINSHDSDKVSLDEDEKEYRI